MRDIIYRFKTGNKMCPCEHGNGFSGCVEGHLTTSASIRFSRKALSASELLQNVFNVITLDPSGIFLT
jgi:hypothetical protein